MLGRFSIADEVETSAMTADGIEFIAFLSPVMAYQDSAKLRQGRKRRIIPLTTCETACPLPCGARLPIDLSLCESPGGGGRGWRAGRGAVGALQLQTWREVRAFRRVCVHRIC